MKVVGSSLVASDTFSHELLDNLSFHGFMTKVKSSKTIANIKNILIQKSPTKMTVKSEQFVEKIRCIAAMSVVFCAHALFPFPFLLMTPSLLLLTVNMTENWTRDNQLALTNTNEHSFALSLAHVFALVFLFGPDQRIIPIFDSNHPTNSVGLITCTYTYSFCMLFLSVCAFIDSMHRYERKIYSNNASCPRTKMHDCHTNVAEWNRTCVDMTI